MAILGNIRKRPIFLVMIIGLALFAFVLSSVLKGNGPSRNNIGAINGNKISVEEFSKRVDAQKSRQNSASSLQSVNSVWNAIVKEKIYENQIEKVGLVIGEKDIWDALVNNPAYQNNPNFKNEEGLFDENKLKEFIATIKSTPEGNRQWLDEEQRIMNSLKQSTYDNLIKAGLTASLKEGELSYKSDNSSADVQFVYEPYASINNADVKITDTEVTAYVKGHADEFKSDATREIEYVSFDVKASDKDIASIKNDLSKIKNDFTEYNKNTKEDENITGFKNTKDNVSFVNEYSDISYVDKSYLAADLKSGIYDSISKLPNGSVYGPYTDGDYFKLVKLINKEDEYSVKSSHILISYEGAERAKPTVKRTKEEAEKLAKDLLKKVTKDNFSVMAKTNSDDSSASRGGELGSWFKKGGNLIKEYADYILNNKKNKIGLVETIFGYHIIKVDETKTEPVLKLAVISRKIDPSEETESNIYQQAETFASDLIDGKDILELAKTNNYAIKKANNITKLSENITGLGNHRDIVKWTFDESTKKGAVKRFDLDNSFVIVLLKNKYKKGLTSLAVAKPKVVPILEKIKKVKLIKDKMTGSTLDEIAQATGKSINSANGITLANPNLKIGGSDENIAGALLYLNEGDVKIIDGKNGVYAIKVVKKSPLHDIKKYDTYANKLTSQIKNKNLQIFNALKEASEIEDQRAIFY